MKDFFDCIISNLLFLEGGFVNNPNDSGGATNFGISCKFLKSLCEDDKSLLSFFDKDGDSKIGISDIKNLTKEDAIYLYRNFFWEKYNFNLLPPTALVQKVFETSVNIGAKPAIKNLQKSINVFLPNNSKIVVDGIIGEKTIQAVNILESKFEKILSNFVENSIAYYRLLVKQYPKNSQFLNGWINRLILSRFI